MVVKEDDLVVATHGRAFWILDDLTPLHQITEETAKADVFLFKPRDAYRMGRGSFPIPNIGQNPPSGSVIYYYFNEKPKEEVILEFLDKEDNLIKKYSSKERARPEPTERRGFRGNGVSRLSVKKGMNRYIWNMRYPDAERVPRAILWGGMLSGPVAVPGTYRVRLTVGEKSMIQAWEWKKDLRLTTTQDDFQEQFDFLIQIRDEITEVNRAINRLRSVKNQIDVLTKKVKDHEKGKEIIQAGKTIKDKLKAVEDVLIQSKSESRQDPLNYPIMLDNKIAALAGVVARSDTRPTDQSYDLFKELSAQADDQIAKLKEIFEVDLAAFV